MRTKTAKSAAVGKSRHTCQRCTHQWQSRKKNPLSCPRCKSYVWRTSVVVS